MSLLTVVVLLVTLTIAHSLPQLRRGKLVHGQEVIINNSSEKVVEKDSPFDYYFTQEVDHFDRANTQVRCYGAMDISCACGTS